MVRLIVVATLLTMAGCAHAPPPMAQLPPPEVTVAKALSEPRARYAYVTGRTVAIETVQMQARVSGYLKHVAFVDGQEVKEDALLFEIDPDPYEAKLEQAKAEVLRWQASLDKAKVDVARNTKLAKSGAVSQEDLDSSIAELKVADASKKGAEAAVREAELNLEYTRITAPFDGRMSKAFITEGNLIAAGATGGPVLSTIVRTDKIRVEFDVDENTALEAMAWRRKEHNGDVHIHAIREAKIPVQIALSNEEDFGWEGILDFADNTIDRATGTIRLRAELDNAQRLLVPGLFVRVRVPYTGKEDRLFIAERALQTDQGDKFVFVLSADDKAEYRRVTVGMREPGGLREIEEGLTADDRVIVDGFQRVRNGKQVKVASTVDMRSFTKTPTAAAQAPEATKQDAPASETSS